jgi:hypothetical protein
MWLSQAASFVHPLSHEKLGAGKHLKMDESEGQHVHRISSSEILLLT